MRLRMRSLMGMIVLLVLAGAMAMAQDNNVFTCSSDDGQLHSCRVDSDQPIQFVRQRSSAQCIEGETYGINRGGVWVTNGCRADFAVGNSDQAYNNGDYDQQGTYSNNGDNDRDDQDNAASNDRDRNTGYRDQNGKWHRRHHGDRDRDRDHDNGTYSQNDPYNQGTYDRQGTYQGPYNNGTYGNGGYVGEGPQQHPTVYYGKYKDGKTTCSAEAGTGPVYCQTNGALSDATITKSNGSCRRGQNWDISSDGLWVADGCSAEFRIQR